MNKSFKSNVLCKFGSECRFWLHGKYCAICSNKNIDMDSLKFSKLCKFGSECRFRLHNEYCSVCSNRNTEQDNFKISNLCKFGINCRSLVGKYCTICSDTRQWRNTGPGSSTTTPESLCSYCWKYNVEIELHPSQKCDCRLRKEEIKKNC